MILVQDSLGSEYFRVFAKDTESDSYFIARMTNMTIPSNEFCWCSSEESLEVGEILKGHLQPSRSHLYSDEMQGYRTGAENVWKWLRASKK